MALRTDWLKTRRQLLTQIKRQVALRLGRSPTDLKLYIRHYNAEFSRTWRKSSQNELNQAVSKCQIALGADFHAFSQSQRIHLRILRALPAKRRVVLVLEALSSAHDKLIADFLAEKISEPTFLAQTKWESRWGFPFANYRPLFDLARSRGYRVAGLSPGKMTKGAKRLNFRDRFGAQVISRWRKIEPESLVYVIVGDLHLAAKHLPNALERELGKDQNQILTILQNSEHLYFRLARLGREHQVEVMRASGGRFCVLSSPPWVKWQSYLMYLEQTYDRDLDSGGLDYTDYVASFAVFIARELGLDINLEELAVFTPQGSDSWRKLVRGLSRKNQKLAEFLIRAERSFFVANNRVLFLARPSTNHAATLAGQFILSRLSGWDRLPWNFPKDFEAMIWVEGIGFFCSKLINHKRKADQLSDLKKLLFLSGQKPDEVLRLALSQRLSELSGRRQPLKFRPRRRESYLEAARIVGHMLGERIYSGYTNGSISAAELVAAMGRNPLSSGFAAFYRGWIERNNE